LFRWLRSLVVADVAISGLIARARARHQALMIDTCVITRNTSSSLNTTTGAYTLTGTTKYSGKCRLRGSTAGAASVRELQAGEAEQPTYRYQLLIPHGSYAAAVGDVVVCDSRTFTVVGEVAATMTTAQALIVEEVQ
jgi:hypothetical protein